MWPKISLGDVANKLSLGAVGCCGMLLGYCGMLLDIVGSCGVHIQCCQVIWGLSCHAILLHDVVVCCWMSCCVFGWHGMLLDVMVCCWCMVHIFQTDAD